MASVIGTGDPFCVSLIVAMSMQNAPVADLVASTLAFGSDMIHFQQICILEKESTPFAFSPLPLKELCQHPIEHRVRLQSSTPIEYITVVWACRRPHFDMPLDMRW